MRIFLLFFISISLIAQTRYPNLPKYPMKSKIETIHEGVWPKSKQKKDDPDSAKFKRIEYMPPQLRLLVRADCNEKLGHKELISKAKKITSAQGGVVEMDWGDVKNKKVSFYAVILLEKRATRFQLVAEDGVYQVTDSHVQKYDQWRVVKLLFPSGRTCVVEENLKIEDMYITLANMLNRLMLPHLNSRVPD